MEKEIWKPLRNFEDSLLVSNKGNIKILERIVNTNKNATRVLTERLLIPRKSNDKYGYVFVSFRLNKKLYRLVVGRVVYETFNDIDLDLKKTIVHKDGNKFNNSLENIKILTRRSILQKRINKEGVIGVSKRKYGYTAQIEFEGTRLHLHTSKNKSECHKIYQLAKSMFDEFDKLKAGILNESRLNNKLIEQKVKLLP